MNNLINPESKILNSNNYDKIDKLDNNNIVDEKNQFVLIEPKTKADLEELPFLLKLKLDHRTFLQFLWDELKDKHPYINIILIKSILKPFFIRLLTIMFDLSLEFSLNAMFFTDEYLDKQAETKLKEGSQSTGFTYVVLNEVSKSFWPVLISFIIGFATSLIILVPKIYKEELNSALISDLKEVQNNGV
jgi:hypothetical protein